MTIEDPIEYQLRDIGQIQVKPKIGLTFATGLRHVLRQDPDVVLVGETRDAGAPFLMEEVQDRADERAGVTDPDPEDEIDYGESPTDRVVDAPIAQAAKNRNFFLSLLPSLKAKIALLHIRRYNNGKVLIRNM